MTNRIHSLLPTTFTPPSPLFPYSTGFPSHRVLLLLAELPAVAIGRPAGGGGLRGRPAAVAAAKDPAEDGEDGGW